MLKSEYDYAFHTALKLSFEETLEQVACVLKADEGNSLAILSPAA